MIDRVRAGAKLRILPVIAIVNRATGKGHHGAGAQNAPHQGRTPHQGFHVFRIREKLRIDQGGPAYVGPVSRTVPRLLGRGTQTCTQ